MEALGMGIHINAQPRDPTPKAKPQSADLWLCGNVSPQSATESETTTPETFRVSRGPKEGLPSRKNLTNTTLTSTQPTGTPKEGEEAWLQRPAPQRLPALCLQFLYEQERRRRCEMANIGMPSVRCSKFFVGRGWGAGCSPRCPSLVAVGPVSPMPLTAPGCV